MSSMRDRGIKCVFVGNDGTGKTTLLRSLASEPTPPATRDHWGILHTCSDPLSVSPRIQGQVHSLLLCDTIGEEGHDRLRPLAYPQTDVFIVCFSLNDRASFSNVMEKWRWEIRHHCPGAAMVIVGNRQEKEVSIISPKEIEGLVRRLNEMRDHRVTYIECVARDIGNQQPLAEVIVSMALTQPEIPRQQKATHRRSRRPCIIL